MVAVIFGPSWTKIPCAASPGAIVLTGSNPKRLNIFRVLGTEGDSATIAEPRFRERVQDAVGMRASSLVWLGHPFQLVPEPQGSDQIGDAHDPQKLCFREGPRVGFDACASHR
jgi:hypothetical protein